MEFTEERVFPAKVEILPEITAFICDFGEKSNIHPKKMMHLDLAIDEVVANICNYAYMKPPGEILVRVKGTEGKFEVSFIDKGIPFDPLSLDDPDIASELNDREIGGLGIFLIRRVMDEVHYKREGDKNILILVLYSENS